MTNELEKKLQKYIQIREDRVFDFNQYTHARSGLGHTGGHLKLQHWLDLQLGFAQAKDAVFSKFDEMKLIELCKALNLSYLFADSQANNTNQFLARPDLGKLIAVESQDVLTSMTQKNPNFCHRDLLIVLSGGLSPLAIEQQIPQFLPFFIHLIQENKWTISPVIINQRGRVAIGDEFNHYFHAKIVVMLIGERPGLTTPNSLGIYFTYAAQPGCTDDNRNCISNIHERGLSYQEAANQLAHMIRKCLAAKISGVMLKDDTEEVKTLD